MNRLKIFMVASTAAMLSSCDLSQIPGLDGKLSIEDSKAIGAACRHSGRALEDCFALNPKSHHAGVFEGWREMNDYMVANEIETVKPEIQPSAFKQAEGSKHAEAKHTDPVSTPKEGDAPAGSSRQRWAPRGQGESAAAQAPATAVAPDVPAATPAPAAEEPKVEAKPEGKSRPWERKKDPKNHT